MSVWITKLALTKGIVEVKEEDVTRFTERDGPGMERGIRLDVGGYVQLYDKPDWHDTKKEARARAEQMRRQRIVFLAKELDRLKALGF